MSHNTERVFDEGVIMVLGEDMQPSLCVRKANGDGKISLYRMQLVGFEDVREILQSLTLPEFKISPRRDVELMKVAEDVELKKGDLVRYDEGKGITKA